MVGEMQISPPEEVVYDIPITPPFTPKLAFSMMVHQQINRVLISSANNEIERYIESILHMEVLCIGQVTKEYVATIKELDQKYDGIISSVTSRNKESKPDISRIKKEYYFKKFTALMHMLNQRGFFGGFAEYEVL